MNVGGKNYICYLTSRSSPSPPPPSPLPSPPPPSLTPPLPPSLNPPLLPSTIRTYLVGNLFLIPKCARKFFTMIKRSSHLKRIV